MTTGASTSVSAVDTMASHFRKIYQRLASLERASSSGALAEVRRLTDEVAALRDRVTELEAR